jgi:hypothetical protein
MSGLFPKVEKPKVAPVQRMPDLEDPANQNAAQERRRRTMANQGRASTIIANDSSSTAYANTKLGQ